MALQKDNHTKISNEFIEEHMHLLSGAAVKIFIIVSRKTVGWHKDTDSISLSQMQNLSGLSKKQVIKAVNELEKIGLIKVDKVVGKTSDYTLNYTSKENTPVKKVHQSGVESTPDEPLTGVESTHTKEIVKETTTKEILITPAEANALTQKLFDYIPKPTRWSSKPPDLNKWSEEIERLHRIDGVSYNLIDQVIDYIFKYDRWKWKEIIQSAAGLRKHFDVIEKRMPKNRADTADDMQSDVDYYNAKIKEMKNGSR